MKSKDLRKSQVLAALGVVLCLALGNARAGMFDTFAFTDDVSTGIDSSKVYTHAYNLGGDGATFDPPTDSVTISGVTFTNVNGLGTIPASYKFSLAGCYADYDLDASANITGEIDKLTKSFNNGGSTFRRSGDTTENQVLTLTGLTPDVNYVFTLYNKTWGLPGNRKVEISATGYTGAYTFDENWNAVGDTAATTGYGNALTYSYTAPESGTLEISIDPIDTYGDGTYYNSYHIYGFTNEVATVPEPGTMVLLLSAVVGFCLLRRRGR